MLLNYIEDLVYDPIWKIFISKLNSLKWVIKSNSYPKNFIDLCIKKVFTTVQIFEVFPAPRFSFSFIIVTTLRFSLFNPLVLGNFWILFQVSYLKIYARFKRCIRLKFRCKILRRNNSNKKKKNQLIVLRWYFLCFVLRKDGASKFLFWNKNYGDILRKRKKPAQPIQKYIDLKRKIFNFFLKQHFLAQVS